MRNSDDLIRAALGQIDSDNENVRLVALEKARSMLSSRGITFAELFEARDQLEVLRKEIAERDERVRIVREKAVERKEAAVSVASGKYIHKDPIPFWRRRHNGKPIKRGEDPPVGVTGVLKILSDEPAYGNFSNVRKILLSFETADAIYHRYSATTSDVEWLNHMRRLSARGSRFRHAA